MTSRSIVAHEFRLSLEAGVIDRGEIIQWADGIIATGAYDDRIAEICMAAQKSDKELESLLSAVAGDANGWDATRRMLGRMYEALQRNPGRLHEFTRHLERIWIRNGYEVPKDLNFIAGLEDDFQLAEEGHWSSLEKVRIDLLENLAPYQIRTGQSGEDSPN